MKILRLYREQIFLMVSACLIAGMLFSRALLSISTITLAVILLASVPFRETLRRFTLQPYALALTALALMPLLSVFWSADSLQWWAKMRDKLPFVVMPLAFAAADFLRPEHRQKLLQILVGLAVLTAAGVLINLGWHYTEIMQGMKAGTPIPAPNGHIRFSLLLCFAACSSLYLISTDRTRKMGWFLAFLFLSISIFVLSTRSGILAWAVAVPLMLFFQLPPKTRIAAAFGSLILIPVLVSFFFYTFPPFRQRMEYMRYDLQQFGAGKIENTSDGMRLRSIQTGWELFKENPVLGVGLGDLEQEARSKSMQLPGHSFEAEIWRIPHNEWIYLMAALGITGLLVFTVASLLIFLTGASTAGPLWWVLHAILFTSFLTEYTIEEQVGAALYWYWILLLKKTD